MLLGAFNGVKVYSFKGSSETPDKFYVTVMNALSVRTGTEAYRKVRKELSS